MNYHLQWCSWELTRQCNMDCDICLCGGLRSAGGPELSTNEALEVCRQLADLQVQQVILTGGEPFLRSDWDIVAAALTRRGITVNMVTNGSLLDAYVVKRVKEAGISQVSISVDGTQPVHDAIRAPGSFKMCCRAIQLLKGAGIPFRVLSTVTRQNEANLPELKNELIQMGVTHWGIQLGLAFGNLVRHREDMLSPQAVGELIEFCYSTTLEGRLKIDLSESIGYYTCKEAIIRSHAMGTSRIPVFEGCPAGISALSIGYDGTIFGMSMCVSKFSEGNVRETSIRQIWESSTAFAWRRRLKPIDLKGYCRNCPYVSACLGGCPAVRYATTGDLYGENRYCMYHLQKQEVLPYPN